MSVESDVFRVTVKGSRESVVKMMSTALKSFNSDKVIVESDDIDTMNSILEMYTGRDGKDIGIPDLLGPGSFSSGRNRYRFQCFQGLPVRGGDKEQLSIPLS